MTNPDERRNQQRTRGDGGLVNLGDVLQDRISRSPLDCHNLPPIPEQEYGCAQCHDAHFLHQTHPNGTVNYAANVIPCDCQLLRIEQERKAHLMKMCELPKGSEDLTFEGFKQIPGTEEAYAAAYEVSQCKVNGLKWLTLVSPPDRGKTHLAVAACRERIRQAEPALYRFIPNLLRELRKGYDDHDYDEQFTRLCEMPLLVLDDLGTENSTPWVQEQLDSIIDHRYVRRLPLIITTNLSADQLAPRIRSRIQRATPWGKVVTVQSPEYRTVRE